MAYDRYAAQVQLLVRILPFVTDEAAFALTGGTAINLFYCDMPRLLVRQGPVEVKVETLPVLRGTVQPVEHKRVTQSVQAAFEFAEMQMGAFEDLFAGKLTAALDRQHPRDLYDVKLLYENEGLTDDLFRTFLIYLASSGRPPHELPDPNLLDLDTCSNSRPTIRQNMPNSGLRLKNCFDRNGPSWGRALVC